MEHTLRTMAAVVAASAVACLPSCHSNERSAQTDAPQVDVASVIEDSVVTVVFTHLTLLTILRGVAGV